MTVASPPRQSKGKRCCPFEHPSIYLFGEFNRRSGSRNGIACPKIGPDDIVNDQVELTHRFEGLANLGRHKSPLVWIRIIICVSMGLGVLPRHGKQGWCLDLCSM